MGYALWAIGAIAFCAVVLSVYVRAAALDVAKLHKRHDVTVLADVTAMGSFTGVRASDRSAQEVLDAFVDVATATPNTRVLAGRPADGLVTVVTRSLVLGFPDVTTAWMTDVGGVQALVVHGRLQYGASDLGVNRRRINGWLAQMGLAQTS